MKDYLPAGSIVRLANVEKKLMIAGVFQTAKDGDGTFHDYLGVPYPEGFLGPGMNFLFDEDKIEEVVFRGYENEEREGFLQFLDLVQTMQEDGVDFASLIAEGLAASEGEEAEAPNDDLSDAASQLV